MTTNRPIVTVTPISNEAGDLTHCLVTVDDKVLEAPFTEASDKLRRRVEDECQLILTVDEVMAVTHASRQQMEREAERLKVVLVGMPAGTVATLSDGMFFWLNAEQALLWDQWMTIGSTAPNDIMPGAISCIGEIDTDELWALAESIRQWLNEPKSVQADLDWLYQL